MTSYEEGRVVRLHSFCCEFDKENNAKIYNARIGSHYIQVQWDNGEWSSDHWASFDSNPFFLVLDKPKKSWVDKCDWGKQNQMNVFGE